MVHLEQMYSQMEEDKNFLHPNICNYCIDLIKSNLNKSHMFGDRYVLPFHQIEDPTIKSLQEFYEKLYSDKYLKNIEIVYWPVNEYHDWHDDTKYYDYTTITYLNDGYEGGRTMVGNITIEPTIGKIVKFPANIRHCVSKLTKGNRYVIVAWFNKNGKNNS